MYFGLVYCNETLFRGFSGITSRNQYIDSGQRGIKPSPLKMEPPSLSGGAHYDISPVINTCKHHTTLFTLPLKTEIYIELIKYSKKKKNRNKKTHHVELFFLF